MTTCEVRGFSRQNRHQENYRGQEYTLDFLPMIKINLVVADHKANTVCKYAHPIGKNRRNRLWQSPDFRP